MDRHSSFSGYCTIENMAKLANETAKAKPEYEGVLSLTQNMQIDELLKNTPVKSIWGIGGGFTQRLFKEGIYNALQLKKKYHQPQWVRSRLKVNGLRTVMELNGEPCTGITERTDTRKGIMTSRSFGEAVTALKDIREAVANFVSMAAQKLRAQHSVASLLSVTLRTSKYAAGAPSTYKRTLTVSFPTPTAHTPHLIEAAQKAAEYRFETGNRYKKAAVMLTGIVPESEMQADLFSNHSYKKDQHELMNRVDEINKKYGKRTTHIAGTGIDQNWQMNQEHLSDGFTTQWDELMEVQAD